MMTTTVVVYWVRATGRTAWNGADDCSSLKRGVLRRQQRPVCSKHIDLMEFVSQAARVTVDLCQQLFAERRWNCSSIELAPKFRRDLTAGNNNVANTRRNSCSSCCKRCKLY